MQSIVTYLDSYPIEILVEKLMTATIRENINAKKWFTTLYSHILSTDEGVVLLRREYKKLDVQDKEKVKIILERIVKTVEIYPEVADATRQKVATVIT